MDVRSQEKAKFEGLGFRIKGMTAMVNVELRVECGNQCSILNGIGAIYHERT